MICVAPLAAVFYQQCTYSPERLHSWATFHWYVLLLGIYVALTNQVPSLLPIRVRELFRFTNGLTRISVSPGG